MPALRYAGCYGETSYRTDADQRNKNTHIVELPVALKELDAKLSRQITTFHTSQNIRVRHGRQITKENKIYFRWCFTDLTVAGVAATLETTP